MAAAFLDAEDYLAHQSPHQATALRTVIAAVGESFPELEITLAWNVPHFRQGKDYVVGLSAAGVGPVCVGDFSLPQLNSLTMLHYCYIVFILCTVSRPSREDSAPVVNRIEQARDAKSLSRGELADLVGVHYQTMGYLERGEYNPSLELALKIARVLEGPLEEIFWLEDEMKSATEKPGQRS